MAEKKQYSSPSSSSSQQACFHGCFSRPSFLCLPYHESLSQAHDHSPKITTNTSIIASPSQYNFIAATLTSLHSNISHFTNHESLPPLHESFSYFNKSFPQFSDTRQADEIRSREYCHLALSNHVCLDYVGIGLFSYPSSAQANVSYHKNAASSLSSSSSPSSNSGPHFPESSFFNVSHKTASLKSQLLLEGEQSHVFDVHMRKRIMDFMNVSEDDYTMVFTGNQLSAFKVLSNSYPFQIYQNLLTVYDYDNEGVEIMINGSEKRGARALSAKFLWPSMRIQSRKLRKIIASSTISSGCSSTINNKASKQKKKGLFVFPLQSRMTGSRYSYQWMSVARENGWHVLLDACALGPKDMETLGLSLFKPDFLICSFYKVFGENPSGFGCLFIKKSTSSILMDSTTSTSIGIVSLHPTPMSTPTQPNYLGNKSNLDDSQGRDNSNYETQDQPSEITEEKNIIRSSQKNITNVEHFNGLDQADSVGLVAISIRSRCLINWVVNALTRLRHPNSENENLLIRIYGPYIGFDRGASLAFNVFDWKGEKVDPILVQKLADRNNIALSCGFLKHIGFMDKSEEDKERRVETCHVTPKTASGRRGGHEKIDICVITITIGFVTNFEDVYKVWSFLARFLDADFVEKERWRYLALNQTTIEV